MKGGTKAHKIAEKRVRMLEIEVRQLKQHQQRVRPFSCVPCRTHPRVRLTAWVPLRARRPAPPTGQYRWRCSRLRGGMLCIECVRYAPPHSIRASITAVSSSPSSGYSYSHCLSTIDEHY